MLIDTYSEYTHCLSMATAGLLARQTRSSGLPEKMSVTIMLAQ